MSHRHLATTQGRTRGLARILLGSLLIVLLTGCAGIPGVYVVEKSRAAGEAEPGKFNADTYVEGIWASKVLPTVEADATPATTLLPALLSDTEATSKKYGHQAGTGSPYSFLVKGAGTVTEVDDNGAVGTMTLKVAGVDKTEVRIAIGPAIVSTAVRDAVGFIDFGQFVNQLDYADAATALNTKVKTTVLSSIDLKTVKGKKVTFSGAFQSVVPSTVTITPVTLKVAL
jgi:predicted lipoprotein